MNKKSLFELFDVYHKGEKVNTVSYVPRLQMTEDDVKCSLVNYDGYPRDIEVKKRKQ